MSAQILKLSAMSLNGLWNLAEIWKGVLFEGEGVNVIVNFDFVKEGESKYKAI